MSSSVQELRDQLFLETVARRLIQGQPRRLIASQLNLRPERLEEILRSDRFLEVLRPRDEQLADEIDRERAATINQDILERLENLARESIDTLESLMRTAESENQRRGAAKDLIDAYRAMKEATKAKADSRLSVPQRTLDALELAAREVDELERLAE